MLANEDLLFNRFLALVLKPLYLEHMPISITPDIQQLLVRNHMFFKKLYAAFVNYPVDTTNAMDKQGVSFQ